MTLFESDLKGLKLLFRGKVRDIYELPGDTPLLLIVATDRLSAFDVILPTPIPDKGKILTAVSNFWFEKLKTIIPNHLTHKPLSTVINDPEGLKQAEGRSVIVKKTEPLKIEAVVRGYLAGSGWKDYQKTGAVCGIPLPSGLQEAARLPGPIFTPATKAAKGAHDENISFDQAVEIVGGDIAEQVREVSLHLYKEASKWAEARGIILADTKFEFGLLRGVASSAPTLIWIDEALTPDSSRFWPKDQYKVGISPPSFDKQFVRDYLESIHWNKKPPAPELPKEIAEKTAEKYREALERLTKQGF
ncbi:MAG: phosphoribosylaminoimidazolesuccinocarboxamide synthase [Deltaproteobacteria bacterium]|nr:phosphoribosylaminoimidazolesuccinocarboxamide synthase [Deltaproteobacteria bacterium]